MNHEFYINRCLELATRAQGYTYPNPLVGCVIVHQGEIISEGWHKKAGEAHAEREAILALQNDPRLKEATLYVNLEPCAHHGRTPPCADLIVESGIPRVVYGCRDPFALVDGKGIERLKNTVSEVIGPVLEKDCRFLNRRFFLVHEKKRPYIILKWAETADGYMAPANGKRTQISGESASVLLHKWRSEENAILVGSNTAVVDKPDLTTRKWNGPNPLRVFIDGNLKGTYHGVPAKTLVINRIKNETNAQVDYVQSSEENLIHPLLKELYEKQIQSVLVEGGAHTLQRFLMEDLWDEIRIIKSKKINFEQGLQAPKMDLTPDKTEDLPEDMVEIYYR